MNDRDSHRMAELKLLDDLAEGFFARACAGDQKSAQLLIDISDRRSKLLGLDAPIQTRMEVIAYDASELRRQYENLSRDISRDGQRSLG